MNTSMRPGRDTASSWRGLLRPLVGGLLLLLAWGSTAPASADFIVDESNSSAQSPYVVDGTVTERIFIESGGVLNIGPDANISSGDATIVVDGGTVNVSGGTIAGTFGLAVLQSGGTVNISGGSVSGGSAGVVVEGGTVNLSGGTISGGSYGIFYSGGTLSIYGSCLALSSNGQLTGTLQYGTPINTPTYGLSAANLFGTATAPVVTLNGAEQLTVECHSSFTDPGATANSACAGPLPAALSFGSVDADSPGTYKLTCSATDPSGNTGWVNRWVTVADTTAPVVSLNGAEQLTVECHGSFTDPGATAKDTCAGSLPATLSFGSVDVNTLGTYKLTYTATDLSGNTGWVNRWVNVVDTTAPVVTLNGAEQLTVECHTPFSDPGATASDANAGSLPAALSFGSVDADSPGIYKLTYSATDPSGNTGWVNRWVTVADTAPPTITLNGSSSMTVDCQIGGSFSDPGATANDACAGGVAVTTSGTVDVTRPGPYTLTYNATDGTNAATPVTRTVTVVSVADLSVTYNTPPATVVTGSNLSYTIAVKNAGPQSAQGVVLTHLLPAGTSFVSATRSPSVGTLTTPKGNSSTVSWNVGPLASGPDVALTVVVKVNAKAGTILTNNASASSSPKDPNLGNNSASMTTSVAPRR
jgi:uncharacterized repeat protein (TIGR01451 family)